MIGTNEDVTVTLPLSAVQDVLALFRDLTERTHELLTRNIAGSLTAIERSDLEMLVRSTEVGRILSMSLQGE